LETNPKDMQILNEIFRVAHTIKGMAATMGYNKMTKLTHQMENVLDDIRNSKIDVNTFIIDVLFECLDFLENAVNNVANNGNEGNELADDIIVKLNVILTGKVEEVAVTGAPKTAANERDMMKLNQYDNGLIVKALEQGYNVFKVKIVLANGCMLKAARAFIVFQTVERYGEIIKAVPSVEDIEDEKFENEFSILIISNENEVIVRKDLESISEIDEVVFEKIDTVEEEILEAAQDNSSETMNDDTTENEGKDSGEDAHNKKSKTGKTVRVDIDRLDNLMNLVSELIIIKTRLEGVGSNKNDQDMGEAVEYLERITTNLHDAVMKVRMVPIERVFNRFPRMVRDLSKELDKDISLLLSGEETELDRTVIDEIGDPLIHLIRNSIDHGIEDKEERAKSGKSLTGNLYLRAYQDGNSVVIEVEDDGNGIDISKVRKKAIEKGIISKNEADTMDEKTSVELLFRPGFSTAEIISDISGRGVGLDVVKTKIESLNGVVEVETSKGKGSKFIIRLPLTLAIIQALMVTVGNEQYAIPLNVIRDITTITTDSIRNIHGQEVVLNRDSVLPIIRLSKVLDIEASVAENEEEMTIVVVKKGEKYAGFIVDSLIGQQEIVIKTLGKYLSGIRFIAGATILGDGQVALIVDTNSLI
jgi:two-component system chemotaxis sensor kinase CheA